MTSVPWLVFTGRFLRRHETLRPLVAVNHVSSHLETSGSFPEARKLPSRCYPSRGLFFGRVHTQELLVRLPVLQLVYMPEQVNLLQFLRCHLSSTSRPRNPLHDFAKLRTAAFGPVSGTILLVQNSRRVLLSGFPMLRRFRLTAYRMPR